MPEFVWDPTLAQGVWKVFMRDTPACLGLSRGDGGSSGPSSDVEQHMSSQVRAQGCCFCGGAEPGLGNAGNPGSCLSHSDEFCG